MLDKIKKDYEAYKEIYKIILPTLTNTDTQTRAKYLLENSLYLSVFTTFEQFLKNVIDHYIYHSVRKGIKFTDLSEGFAHSIFLARKKQIKHILDTTGNRSKNAFKGYFNLLKSNLPKETLKNHIHFEFPHEKKLNSYYKDLFQEILGDDNFLSNLKLSQTVADFTDGLLTQKLEEDAFTFLCNYITKIRNNIAHKNEDYIVEESSSFNKVVDTFYEIISKIAERYRTKTGFILTDTIEDNILDSFDNDESAHHDH